MGKPSIIVEIANERARQDALWGNDFDDKNTANDWGQFIVNYLGKATYDGRKKEYSPEKFRKNMLIVATLAVAAVEAVDRNGDCAPRHYEGLPRAGAKEETKPEQN